MKLIDVFMFDEIDIKELSYRLFNADKEGYREADDLYVKSLIVPDNIKRHYNDDYIYPYKTAQFYHFRDQDSILEKS